MKIQDIEITNPDKILFLEDKITKLDVVKYYSDISKYMIKEIYNRPLSVIRCHENNECFFKKHPTTEKQFIHTFNVKNDQYFYLQTPQEIVYQAQMGSVEFHIWGCEYPKINTPNLMVFDLDPDENLNIKQLRQGVKHLKSILDELNLTSYLKTSGGKGYHITVPFEHKKTWKQFSELSRDIAEVMAAKWPDLYTTNIRKINRQNKIFIDFLRNTKGATCVAPFSLRSRKSATISMPISWDMLDKIKPNEVNIKNYKKYLKYIK